jgi:RNA polymerase sigma-70 factor (ECF subfamily)
VDDHSGHGNKGAVAPTEDVNRPADPAGDAGRDIHSTYLESAPILQHYVRQLMPKGTDKSEVDDIMQDVYLRAFAARKSEKLENAKAYLFRIARNLSFKARAGQKKNVISLLEDLASQGIIDDVVAIDEQLHQKKRLMMFAQAVETLPPQCRQVFVLRQMKGLSHKEIAKTLGISVSTVEKHIAKALQLCAKYMNECGY